MDFHYRATDANGQSSEGTLRADSLSAARNAVASLGLEPIEIYPEPQLTPSPQAPEELSKEEPTPTVYFPLLETMRLYAGWLLAWYSLVYAVGSYQFLNDLPVHIPYAESLFLSPLVLSFTFAAYLFLLLSGIYTFTGRKKLTGILLTFVGITVFVVYRMNVV